MLRKSRIAIVLPDLGGGGAERVSLHLAQDFLARGYDVDFALMRRTGELLDLLPSGARVIDLEAPRLRNLPSPLAKYLTREQPDGILASMWPLTAVAAASKKLAGASGKLIVCEHDNLSRAYVNRGMAHRVVLKVSIAAAHRLADARVAVSTGVAADLSRLSGIPLDKFDVVYNPIPRPLAGEIEVADKHWRAARGRRRILSVGSFKAQKNHVLLLRAFARIAASMDAALILLGEGDLRGKLEATARAEGIADRVHMPGFVTNPAPFYKTADLFVLASNHEGFGNVIVEAMACGLPVVSTDCPSGPAEILENGRYGRLVPVGDVDALATAMAEALRASHDREALKRRAADFSPDKAANKYLELLFPNEGRS